MNVRFSESLPKWTEPAAKSGRPIRETSTGPEIRSPKNARAGSPSMAKRWCFIGVLIPFLVGRLRRPEDLDHLSRRVVSHDRLKRAEAGVASPRDLVGSFAQKYLCHYAKEG